jgi:hypothetical protein
MITAATVAGASTVQRIVVLESTTLAADWTDADLCAAVASSLNVPVADVGVAVYTPPPQP